MDDAGLSIGGAANKTKWWEACDKWLVGRMRATFRRQEGETTPPVNALRAKAAGWKNKK